MSHTSRLLQTSLTAGKAAVPAIVGGQGVFFELADGRRVIDASNTAAPLGHAHPELVEALASTASSPVINEGWGWAARHQAADDLIELAFGGEESWVGAVRFFLSASEANDAALALCQALTGRRPLATRERAYHGGAGLAREMTVQPHWHGGLSSPSRATRTPPRLAEVHRLPAPAGARIGGQSGQPHAELDRAELDWILGTSAAAIIDYSQGGVYQVPEYQDQVAQAARAAGAVWIADEAVTGLGRLGGWFAFQRGASRPDIVTLGKPLAGSGTPAGAVVLSEELLEQLDGSSWQTYSTFRAHPAMVASLSAHLRVLTRDRLTERANEFDGLLFRRLREIADRHPSVERIDGRALHWTIELRGPSWRQWEGQENEPLASRIAARALEAGCLIATSGEQTSLFIAPPLIIEEEELETILEALDHGLELADREQLLAA